MGMQQLFTLVLIVVLVGIAIAVGITMFSNSAYQANIQAITAELQTFRARAAEYWRTPPNMGGAGQDVTRTDAESMALYMGFERSYGKTAQAIYAFNSDNAEYHFSGEDSSAEIAIQALGKEAKGSKFPFVTLTYDMMTNESEIDISSAESFTSSEMEDD